MMDFFCEYIVKKKVEVLDCFKLAGIIAAAFVLAFAALILGLNFDMSIGFLLVAVVVYFTFIFSKFIYTEYEYALTNSELDVDKILGRSRRKRLVSVDFKKAEICACIDDERYQPEYSNTANIKKTYNATGKSDYAIYFVDYYGDGGKERILFQPTDKMKDAMKMINPRTIHIKD